MADTPEQQWLNLRADTKYFRSDPVYGLIGNYIQLRNGQQAAVIDAVMMNNRKEGAKPENFIGLYMSILMRGVGSLPIVISTDIISKFDPDNYMNLYSAWVDAEERGYRYAVGTYVEHQRSSKEELMTYKVEAHAIGVQVDEMILPYYLYRALYGSKILWAHTKTNFEMNKNEMSRFHSLTEQLNINN